MTGQIKVSKKFLRAFGYLANFYGWLPDDIEEIKQVVRENTGYREYLEMLADAHRNGYKQTKENNYMRLAEWQRLQRLGHDNKA